MKTPHLPTPLDRLGSVRTKGFFTAAARLVYRLGNESGGVGIWHGLPGS